MTAGVRGSKQIVAEVDTARGSVSWLDGRRHGVVPERLLGDIVRVMA